MSAVENVIWLQIISKIHHTMEWKVTHEVEFFYVNWIKKYLQNYYLESIPGLQRLLE